MFFMEMVLEEPLRKSEETQTQRGSGHFNLNQQMFLRRHETPGSTPGSGHRSVEDIGLI